jgi:hypothetical protein
MSVSLSLSDLTPSNQLKAERENVEKNSHKKSKMSLGFRRLIFEPSAPIKRPAASTSTAALKILREKLPDLERQAVDVRIELLDFEPISDPIFEMEFPSSCPAPVVRPKFDGLARI